MKSAIITIPFMSMLLDYSSDRCCLARLVLIVYEDVEVFEGMEACEDAKMRRCEDAKMRRCEDTKMRRCEDAKMRRCEDG